MTERNGAPHDQGIALPLMEGVQIGGKVYVHEPEVRKTIDFILALKQKEIDALNARLSETGPQPDWVPALTFLQRHRRQVELSPGAGQKEQAYALGVLDDLDADLRSLLPKAAPASPSPNGNDESLDDLERKLAQAEFEKQAYTDALRYRWLRARGIAWRDCYGKGWQEGEWAYGDTADIEIDHTMKQERTPERQQPDKEEG